MNSLPIVLTSWSKLGDDMGDAVKLGLILGLVFVAGYAVGAFLGVPCGIVLLLPAR